MTKENKDSQLEAMLSICAELEHKGIAPTSGLLRAKFPKRIPLPAIISALRYWQSMPKGRKVSYKTAYLSAIQDSGAGASPSMKDKTPTSSELSISNKNAAHEPINAKLFETLETLETLKSRIAALESQVKDLQTEVLALKQQ
uniref:hypothetical protein n=1 Tax=Ningiella ruwaisensis TaxID=2364274 RepID=UPI0010A01E5B|nr:hypothetical protein [Ningiella ruwaisensis]